MILKSPTTWLSLIIAISLGILAARYRVFERESSSQDDWQVLLLSKSATTIPLAVSADRTVQRERSRESTGSFQYPAARNSAATAAVRQEPMVQKLPQIQPRESKPAGGVANLPSTTPRPADSIAVVNWNDQDMGSAGSANHPSLASPIAVTPAQPSHSLGHQLQSNGSHLSTSGEIAQVTALQEAPPELVGALPTTMQQAISTIQAQTRTTENGETRLTLPAPALSTGPLTTANPSANAASLRPDSRVEGDREKITLRLNNEDLRLVLEMVSMESGLSILTSESVQGKVTANFSNVSTMQALEAVLANAGYQMQQKNDILFVGTPQDFQRMEEVSLEAVTRVIRPCFVSAAELEALLKPQLTANGTIQVTSAAVHGLAQSSSSGSTTTLGSVGGVGNGGNGSGATSGDYTGNDIIVVRDVPTAIARVEELVQQIDVPPVQVAIEALILSVNLDDKHRLGVNLELLKGDGVRVVSGNLPGTLDSLETGQGLLSLGFLEANVGSFIAALDDIGETNVIAAPHVLALNKMPAQILIGEQIGFANTTVTQTAATQSIQFLDVGTQLQLRPHVNDEGLIRLEIHPEVSQGTVRSVGDLALPEKTVTQVTTNVMCRDNETIIIGGLIREEIDDTHRGVPLVGKMPLLGPMFRSRTRNTTRQELLVLLTPHVIRDPADALPDPQVVQNFVDRRASILINERKNRVLRKQEAQRYVSLARNAWVSGNSIACERYSTIAVELDPACAESLSFVQSAGVPMSGPQSLGDVEEQLTFPPIDGSTETPPAIIRYVDETGADSSAISPSGTPVFQDAAEIPGQNSPNVQPPNSNIGLPFGSR